MYCWSCGKSVKGNLNFCSGCGARVEKDQTESEMTRAGNFSSPVSYLGVFGLGGFIFLVLSLLKKDLEPGFVFAISALYLGALFAICYLLIRQGSAKSEKPSEAFQPEISDYAAPEKFRAGVTNRLEPAKSEPVPPVTEETTKTLDKVLVERK